MALTSCCFTSGQGLSKDSLYLKKIFANQSNWDSILHYANKLETSKNACFVYEGKIHKSKYYYKKGEYHKSEKKVRTILKELQNKDDFCFTRIRIEALNRLFWIKKNQKSYEEAHKFLIKIEKEIKKISKKNSYYQTIMLTLVINQSIIESLVGHDKEARKILKKYIYFQYDNYQEFSKKANKANILNMIGESYLKSNCCHISSELDSASLYFKKAFEITKTFNPLHNDSEILYNIRTSEILVAKKQYNKALEVLRKWSFKAKKLKTDQTLNSLKAICFFNLNNSDSTLHYGKKVIADRKEKGNSGKNYEKILEILANQYYKNKQLDSATKYSKLAISEIKIIGKNKEEIYKAHHKHEIKNMEEQKDNLISNYKKDFNTFYTFLIGIIIFLGTIFFDSYNKGNISKKNRLLDEKKRVPIPQKKIYSIDPKLEQKIINGLKNLENSSDYLSTSFNLNKFAKRLQTNTSYVSFIINNEEGITFKQYYTSLRIEYIIKKLREYSTYKKFTIQYLGEIVGYKNASAFTRAFKKHQGITPYKFIKQL